MAAADKARKSERWQEAQDFSEETSLSATAPLGALERGRRACPAPFGINGYWETNAAISLAPAS